MALVGCASARQEQRHGNLFSELQPGERITIRFTSQGCFHYFGYDFEFARNGTTTARITPVECRLSTAGHSNDYHTRQSLGTLTLTSTEISGLDRLVRFYRTHPKRRCTTVDEITIKHLRGKSVIATENYIDASCDTYNLRRVTTLPSLVKRIESDSHERTKHPR